MELKVGLNKMNEPIDSCRYGSSQEDPQVHGCGIHNKLALNAEQIQKTKKEISENMFTWMTIHTYIVSWTRMHKQNQLGMKRHKHRLTKYSNGFP